MLVQLRRSITLVRAAASLEAREIYQRYGHYAHDYLHNLVWTAIHMVVPPAIAIVVGALLGGVAPAIKYTLLTLAGLYILWMTYYVSAYWGPLITVIRVLAAAEAAGQQNFRPLAATWGGATFYAALLAATLVSEFGIILAAWFLPVHEQPALLIPLFFAVLIIVGYRLWKGGMAWWPTLVHGEAIVIVAFTIISMVFPGIPRALGYARQSINQAINCSLPDANCPPAPADRRAPNGPPPLPFNRKPTTDVQTRSDGCTEVWMRGNEEQGVPVGTLAPGQTARIRYLNGRITYNDRGESWPHWGADYSLPQWRTSLRFHDRERKGVMPHAILGVLGELGSPAAISSFKRNQDEFTIANSEPTPLPLLLYYHDGLQFYAQNGWEGSRANLEVCVLSTTARVNGTP